MEFGNDPLSWLIAPVSKSSFLSDYFNQKHLWCKNEDRTRFSELLSFAELDNILGTYGLKHPEIRLAQFNQDLSPGEYTKGDTVDPMRVARLYSEGATVIYRALQYRHANIQQLCSALSKQATIQTQANIYLTPPDSQGFKIHWDTHDVFIIQVEGSKVWRIYEGGIPIPIRTQRFDSKKYEPGEVLDEFTLHAGQVLYIPRGIMHAASSTSEGSLHITLGCLGYSWAELLIDVLAEHLEAHPTWRENMPFGFANSIEGMTNLDKVFRDRIETLKNEADLSPVIEALLLKIRGASWPRESHFMRNAMEAGQVSAEDTIAFPDGLTIQIGQIGDRTILIAGSHEISFPSAAQSMLTQLSEKGPTPIKALDPSLDIESRLNVAKRLLKEGLIVRC